MPIIFLAWAAAVWPGTVVAEDLGWSEVGMANGGGADKVRVLTTIGARYVRWVASAPFAYLADAGESTSCSGFVRLTKPACQS